MPIRFTDNDTALTKGIKVVGIGKKGSRSLEPGLICELKETLGHPSSSEAATGALLGAILIKGPDRDEKALETKLFPNAFSDPPGLIDHLAPKAPEDIKNLCVRLIKKETLNKEEAYRLGKFLFSDIPHDSLRGLAASILRVRYETADEYEGLLSAVGETYRSDFASSPPEGMPIIQIAEPFDGVDRSNMITPLIADELKEHGFRVVSLVGRNSGPKHGNNLFGIAREIGADFLNSSNRLTDSTPHFGYYLNQADLSPALDRWVDIRRQIVKRPFLATIERFVNPFQADIMIASAFHPPYGKKMIDICERVGFPASIIVRNGMEGTTAFPLKRTAKILISVKSKDGYIRHEIEFDAGEHVRSSFEREERLENPSLKDNCRYILNYKEKRTSGNPLFDTRVKATQAGLTKALKWIREKRGKR